MTETLVNIIALGAYALSIVGVNTASRSLVNKGIKKEVAKKAIDTSTEEGAKEYSKIALRHKILGATCTTLIGAGLGAGTAYALNNAGAIAGWIDGDECTGSGCIGAEAATDVTTTVIDGVEITTF